MCLFEIFPSLRSVENEGVGKSLTGSLQGGKTSVMVSGRPHFFAYQEKSTKYIVSMKIAVAGSGYVGIRIESEIGKTI